MEMRFSRQGLAFAGQRRPAPGAKSPPSTGRRIELGYLTFDNGIRSAVECHEDRNGRTAMLPTTLAMTPRHSFRLAGSQKADRAAQAATFELFSRATHNLTLSTRLLDVGRRIPARDRFARDSPLEGNGFEPSVPRVMDGDLGRQVPAVFELAGTAMALQRGTKVVWPHYHPEFP